MQPPQTQPKASLALGRTAEAQCWSSAGMCVVSGPAGDRHSLRPMAQHSLAETSFYPPTQKKRRCVCPPFAPRRPLIDCDLHSAEGPYIT